MPLLLPSLPSGLQAEPRQAPHSPRLATLLRDGPSGMRHSRPGHGTERLGPGGERLPPPRSDRSFFQLNPAPLSRLKVPREGSGGTDGKVLPHRHRYTWGTPVSERQGGDGKPKEALPQQLFLCSEVTVSYGSHGGVASAVSHPAPCLSFVNNPIFLGTFAFSEDSFGDKGYLGWRTQVPYFLVTVSLPTPSRCQADILTGRDSSKA